MKIHEVSVAHPRGADIIAQFKRAEIREIAAVPDVVTSDGLLLPMSQDPAFRLTRLCKEVEGVSICAAMSYNGTFTHATDWFDGSTECHSRHWC
ncbi:MAG: hypothetical protein AB8B62_19055 [Roseobacter sp.]